MGKARHLANLLNADGDVKTDHLDNVPASNDASALSTGTLPAARLPGNITDTGTEGTKIASGTTAQRGSTAGQIRFNSTTGLAEYYDGNQFKSIDAPPSVSSVSPTDVGESTISSNPSLVITGSNFSSTVTVKIKGDDGTEYTPASTTRDSTTQVTITLPSNLTNANEAYDVTVQNTSGLDFTLADAFNINATPVFGVASGSLGTLAFDGRESSNLTAITATDDEGTTVTFSITTGSPPTGLTFNSNGTWSGTADSVNATATSNFTVTATDGGESVTRDYSITVQSEPPAFTHASGSLGSIFDSQRSSYSITNPVATIGGSATITGYTIQSGSLPSGLSINATTGAIEGTASAVGSNTTSTFTVRATASTGTTADRQYTILVYAPQTASYGSSSSSQTFDTTNVKNFTAYLWGAGGVGATGGFVSGSVSVASGTNTLYIAVGGAGSAGNDTNVWKGGKGNRGGNGSYSGGGFTGLFTGSSPSQGNAVLIAGGGGARGSNNNNGPYNGGNHQSGGNNCCGTGGAGSGSALQGGSGGGGSQPGGGGGGGYVGGGGGGGACCSGAGGYGGSNYTSGDSGSATTSSTSSVSNNNTGHSLHQSTWGNDAYDGRLLIVY